MLDDTKGVIRNRKLTKDRQYNRPREKEPKNKQCSTTQHRKEKTEQHKPLSCIGGIFRIIRYFNWGILIITTFTHFEAFQLGKHNIAQHICNSLQKLYFVISFLVSKLKRQRSIEVLRFWKHLISFIVVLLDWSSMISACKRYSIRNRHKCCAILLLFIMHTYYIVIHMSFNHRVVHCELSLKTILLLSLYTKVSFIEYMLTWPQYDQGFA